MGIIYIHVRPATVGPVTVAQELSLIGVGFARENELVFSGGRSATKASPHKRVSLRRSLERLGLPIDGGGCVRPKMAVNRPPAGSRHSAGEGLPQGLPFPFPLRLEWEEDDRVPLPWPFWPLPRPW